MADEVRGTVTLKLENGNLKDSRSRSNVRIDQTTQAVVSGVQNIGTTGDLTTPKYCWIQNLDDTNFVEIGLDVGATFYPFARLDAGSDIPMLIYIPSGVTIYAQADTAACDIDRMITDA